MDSAHSSVPNNLSSLFNNDWEDAEFDFENDSLFSTSKNSPTLTPAPLPFHGHEIAVDHHSASTSENSGHSSSFGEALDASSSSDLETHKITEDEPDKLLQDVDLMDQIDFSSLPGAKEETDFMQLKENFDSNILNQLPAPAAQDKTIERPTKKRKQGPFILPAEIKEKVIEAVAWSYKQFLQDPVIQKKATNLKAFLESQAISELKKNSIPPDLVQEEISDILNKAAWRVQITFPEPNSNKKDENKVLLLEQKLEALQDRLTRSEAISFLAEDEAGAACRALFLQNSRARDKAKDRPIIFKAAYEALRDLGSSDKIATREANRITEKILNQFFPK